MKKTLCALLLTVISCTLFLNSCKEAVEESQPVIEFPQNALICMIGDGSCSNIATSSLISGQITYDIDDPTIATVDATTGVIKPLASGTTLVHATQQAIPGKSKEGTASYQLTVLGITVKGLFEVSSRDKFSPGDIENPFLIGVDQLGNNYTLNISTTLSGTTFSSPTVFGAGTATTYIGFKPDLHYGYWENVLDGTAIPVKVTITNGPTTYVKTFSLIKTAATELYTWRDVKNIGLNTHVSPAFKLMNDIAFPDINSKGLPATGFVLNSFGDYKFTGTLDGDGHKLINFSGTVGLFSYLQGNIKNLGIEIGSGKIIGASGLKYAGAFAGENHGKIENSYATGKVETTGLDFVGGIVGLNAGTITHCHFIGDVTGSASVGGIAGNNYFDGGIYNSYAEVTVTGGSQVGGIAGRGPSGYIWNCYAKGSVRATDLVGGIIGVHLGDLRNSYFIGSVSATSSVAGGIIGLDNAAVTSHNYFDKEQTGAPQFAVGTRGAFPGSYNSVGEAENKTAAEMKDQATYVGWNFTTTWQIGVANNGYPILK